VSQKPFETERRDGGRSDRRKRSRSGRRSADPHRNWQRLTWLFAFYVAYVSLRSLPASIRRVFTRSGG
jgi:hypothetical protein